MKQKNKSLSIIYPAYNEQENIEGTILKSYKFAKDHFKDFEIIIVDDGSRDKTNLIARSVSKKISQVRVIKNVRNLGYGATVWKGLRAASKDLIFFSDSDQQFDINELKKLINHIDNNDVVIGYRKKRQDSFLRVLNMVCWRIAVFCFLGLRYKDIDCAFKLFEKKVLHSLNIKSKGATFSAELLYKIKSRGYKIKEIAVSHYPRVKGKATGANPKVIARAIRDLLLLSLKRNNY